MVLYFVALSRNNLLPVQSFYGRGKPVRTSLVQGPEEGQSVTAELFHIPPW